MSDGTGRSQLFADRGYQDGGLEADREFVEPCATARLRLSRLIPSSAACRAL
ncbi:hypothetical protein ACIPJV_13870 [Streptomyces halstedii]|uniref:hypothetical protein n=1 Tax=Streptomyces halstedii TaxID=1944 RepID=UPI003825D8F5